MREVINEKIKIVCKNKKTNFIIWYIFAYIASLIYGCFRYGWHSPLNFFPIKLFPFLVAKVIGGSFYSSLNNTSWSEMKLKKEIILMFIGILSAMIVGMIIYKFTGVNLIWLII